MKTILKDSNSADIFTIKCEKCNIIFAYTLKDTFFFHYLICCPKCHHIDIHYGDNTKFNHLINNPKEERIVTK